MAAHPSHRHLPGPFEQNWPTPPPEAPEQGDGLLTEQALAFLARYRWVLLTVPYLLLRAWNLRFLSPNQDVKRYFDAATAWLNGRVPYSGFQLEYPPGALPLFVLPKWLLGPVQQMVDLSYNHYFAALMVAFDLLNLWLVGRVARALRPDPEAVPTPTQVAYTTLAQGTYVAWVAMLGYLGFERYDLAFSALVVAFLAAALAPGAHWKSDVLLALSIWVKGVSAAFVPLYLIYCYAEDRDRAEGGKLSIRAWLLGPGLGRLTGIVGTTAVLFAPFYYMAGDALFNFLHYHQNRGLQIESMLSSLYLLGHSLFDWQVGTQFAFGATEITAPVVPTLVRITSGLAAGGVALLTLVQGRALLQANAPGQRRALWVRGILALTLALLATNKVYSPQYMLWLGPLVAAATLVGGRQWRHDVLCLFVANALTNQVLFFYYINLLRLEPMGIALLATRNLLVAGLAVRFVQFEFSPPKAVTRFLEGMSAWSAGRWLSGAALVACGTWVFAANMSETTANDIWIQLRSGEDIVRSLKLPYTETYSATVSGRPFIAHEWLAGVLFYASTLVLGDAGLSVMTALVALGIFAMMYVTFPRTERNRFYYLPTLLFLNYLIAFRLLARPHIFTILAQAYMIMAIERWRRSGRAAPLLGLIPMQLIWINLHGAALFGPALMGMVFGITALSVWWPQLGTMESRPLGQRDIWVAGGMTAAMAAACFINPYGSRIVTFSLDLLHNEYAKNRVWEWTTPFLPMNTYYYWLWLFIVGLALVWAALLVRVQKLPLLDIGYTVLATYLGVRANRFMPDFALLAFPVIMRSLDVATRRGLPAWAWRRQPWLELGIVSLLLANCFTYGYAHSAREHRPMFGWGYGGDMPYQEVALLKRLGVRGIIFNEYSDGSLIINQLTPHIKPVLDSRIDLYPLDFVAEYDASYLDPKRFVQFLGQRHVEIVMLYKHRVPAAILQQLKIASDWRLLSESESRVLYVTRQALGRALARPQREGRRPA